jgi:hypothetical protein
MNDLRVSKARQIEASILEAARAYLDGNLDKSYQIRELLIREGVPDVSARHMRAVGRLRGINEFISEPRPYED